MRLKTFFGNALASMLNSSMTDRKDSKEAQLFLRKIFEILH